MTIRISNKEIPDAAAPAKRWWRSEIRTRLAGITDRQLYDASCDIRKAVVHTPEYRNAGTILMYVGVGREVFTSELLTGALKHGKRVAIPRCIEADAEGGLTIEAREFNNGYKLVAGKFGIPEPAETAPLIPPEEIDLAIVPCLSCDLTGTRLGKGGGCYDRYLTKLRPDCRKMALCLDEIMVEELPKEAHDVKMNAVMTELKLYRIGENYEE